MDVRVWQCARIVSGTGAETNVVRCGGVMYQLYRLIYGVLSGSTQSSIGVGHQSSRHKTEFKNVWIDLFWLSLSIFPLSITHRSAFFHTYNVKVVQSLPVMEYILALTESSLVSQSWCFIKLVWMWNPLVDNKSQVVAELLLWIVKANRAH